LVVRMNLRLGDVKRGSILFEEQSLKESADFQVQGAVSQTISAEEAAVRSAALEIAGSIVRLPGARFCPRPPRPARLRRARAGHPLESQGLSEGADLAIGNFSFRGLSQAIGWKSSLYRIFGPPAFDWTSGAKGRPINGTWGGT